MIGTRIHLTEVSWPGQSFSFFITHEHKESENFRGSHRKLQRVWEIDRVTDVEYTCGRNVAERCTLISRIRMRIFGCTRRKKKMMEKVAMIVGACTRQWDSERYALVEWPSLIRWSFSLVRITPLGITETTGIRLINAGCPKSQRWNGKADSILSFQEKNLYFSSSHLNQILIRIQ